MRMGQRVLVRENNEVYEGSVKKILNEDLIIDLNNGNTVQRKFWEIRKIQDEE